MGTPTHRRVSVTTIALFWVIVAGSALAQQRSPPWPTAEKPAYPSSPYHGAVDGSGRVIPCRCRFQGQTYGLGHVVCMTTHVGVVLARCDLMLNNTSWVPTPTPCTLSGGEAPRRLASFEND